MADNSYRVVTRISKKEDRNGLKLQRENCGICCTGHYWIKPCENEEFENCDDCVCFHCDDCKCEAGENNVN